MIDQNQVSQIHDLFERSVNTLIIFPHKSKPDFIAAAASLYLGLSSKKDRGVTLLTTDKLGELSSKYPGLDQAQTQIGNKNLQVSFPYDPEEVDKVSYHIDEEEARFYLMVQPQKGRQPLDYKKVEFAMVGAEADLIFLVGVTQLDLLHELYVGYESVYDDATLVTLHNFEPSYGQIKLNSTGLSSVSEATYGLLNNLGIGISGDMATNLLQGIESSTDSLQSLTANADTFQAVAELMRLGARRVRRTPTPSPRVSSTTQPPVSKTLLSGSGESFAEVLGKKLKQKADSAKATKPKATKLKTTKSKKKTKTLKSGGLDHQPGMGVASK